MQVQVDELTSVTTKRFQKSVYTNIGYSIVRSTFQVPHLPRYLYNKTRRVKITEFYVQETIEGMPQSMFALALN